MCHTGGAANGHFNLFRLVAAARCGYRSENSKGQGRWTEVEGYCRTVLVQKVQKTGYRGIDSLAEKGLRVSLVETEIVLGPSQGLFLIIASDFSHPFIPPIAARFGPGISLMMASQLKALYPLLACWTIH